MEADSIKTVFSGNNVGGVVTFGMPAAIQFASGYAWERTDVGLTGIAADWIQGGERPEIFQEVKEGIAKLFQRQFAQTNAFGSGTIYSNIALKAPNPKEAILFKGVSHREFQMTFNIASDEQSEMTRIMTELNTFYRLCAPKIIDDGLFFEYPETWNLSIKDGDKDIIKERFVAVTSIDTNLNPQGVFAVFENGTPVNIQLQVGCIELNLPTRQADNQIFTV